MQVSSRLLKYSTQKLVSLFLDLICHRYMETLSLLQGQCMNNELLVFAPSDGGNGKFHTMQQVHPNSTWFTSSCSLPNEDLVCNPIVFGDCVCLQQVLFMT